MTWERRCDRDRGHGRRGVCRPAWADPPGAGSHALRPRACGEVACRARRGGGGRAGCRRWADGLDRRGLCAAAGGAGADGGSDQGVSRTNIPDAADARGSVMDGFAVLDLARAAVGGSVCLLALVFLLGGAIGALRLPDFYTRLHAASVAD